MQITLHNKRQLCSQSATSPSHQSKINWPTFEHPETPHIATHLENKFGVGALGRISSNCWPSFIEAVRGLRLFVRVAAIAQKLLCQTIRHLPRSITQFTRARLSHRAPPLRPAGPNTPATPPLGHRTAPARCSG